MAKRLKTLRLILGDQLNHQHSWFNEEQDDTTYVLMEMRQETDYVVHHIQKIVAFFSAMRNFANYLRNRDFEVIYLSINDSDNLQNIDKNLGKIISDKNIEKFEYQFPDEYRLDEQLKKFSKQLNIESEAYDSEHFFTKRDDLEKFYEGKKQLIMEYFYRHMRKKHNILMALLKIRREENGILINLIVRSGQEILKFLMNEDFVKMFLRFVKR